VLVDHVKDVHEGIAQRLEQLCVLHESNKTAGHTR
jgi:hypothetical protein